MAKPPSGPDDRERMMRVAAGDDDAFTEIVKRYQRDLLNYFLRLGVYYDEAEDLAQETFARLYRYRRRYRPLAGFRTFLFTLARNARVDRIRRSGREPVDMAGPLPTDGPGISGSQDISDARMDVAQAVARLSERLRETVVLTAFQGLSYPEAAEVLGIPLGTVKSRMFAAIRQLGGFLGKEGNHGTTDVPKAS
jgi:RNA polymerase sigma-70 factor (ECF subfamily)